jgi:hypothetical protein
MHALAGAHVGGGRARQFVARSVSSAVGPATVSCRLWEQRIRRGAVATGKGKGKGKGKGQGAGEGRQNPAGRAGTTQNVRNRWTHTPGVRTRRAAGDGCTTVRFEWISSAERRASCGRAPIRVPSAFPAAHASIGMCGETHSSPRVPLSKLSSADFPALISASASVRHAPQRARPHGLSHGCTVRARTAHECKGGQSAHDRSKFDRLSQSIKDTMFTLLLGALCFSGTCDSAPSMG